MKRVLRVFQLFVKFTPTHMYSLKCVVRVYQRVGLCGKIN